MHIPFFLPNISQIEKQLISFSAHPSAYINQFLYLSQAYDLTWHDFCVIQDSTLTLEEQSRIQAAVRQYAEQTHLVDNTVPVGELAVQATEPYWDYQPD